MLAERQHDQARVTLDIGGFRIERQKSSARVLAKQKIDRRADGGVGEAGQRLGRRDDVPDAADVGKGDQKRRFTLGAAQGAHQVRLVLVASCSERENERVERLGGRALKQPDEPAGVFPDQGP